MSRLVNLSGVLTGVLKQIFVNRRYTSIQLSDRKMYPLIESIIHLFLHCIILLFFNLLLNVLYYSFIMKSINTPNPGCNELNGAAEQKRTARHVVWVRKFIYQTRHNGRNSWNNNRGCLSQFYSYYDHVCKKD